MANRIKGEVALVAGDKTYTLVFSVNAICYLENLWNCGFEDVAARLADMQHMRMNDMREMFVAALCEFHPEVKAQEAGRIMRMAGHTEALNAMMAAFVASMPEGGDGPLEDAGQPSSAGSGKTSIVNGVG